MLTVRAQALRIVLGRRPPIRTTTTVQAAAGRLPAMHSLEFVPPAGREEVAGVRAGGR
jgi:hypothetical protein